ncbi:MAG: hypothetical protein AAF549_05750 [Pseudomonadota bacterium]
MALRYALAIVAGLGAGTSALAQSLPSDGMVYQNAAIRDTFANCGQGNFSHRSTRTEICLETLSNVTRNLSQYYLNDIPNWRKVNNPNVDRMRAVCREQLGTEILQGDFSARANFIIGLNRTCNDVIGHVVSATGVRPSQEVTYSLATSILECAEGIQRSCSDLNRIYEPFRYGIDT